jgi:hypothetical protein
MKILVNAIICKVCGDKVISRRTHDYKRCKCGLCINDGGQDYFKRSGEYIEVSITSDDSHHIIRANFEWGSYGKKGDESLHYIKLKDMEQEHIEAIVKTQNLPEELKKVFRDELVFRIDEKFGEK